MDLEPFEEPEIFWKYFLKISKIPRCPGNEQKARKFVETEAKRLGFITKTDRAGNLLVEDSNHQKKNKTLILQSHLDMVCEKNKNSEHNFKIDPLKLKIIEEEGKKWVKAVDTTLGADNGTGIATMLSLMNLLSQKNLKVNDLNIKFVFTVNEESGFIGAYQIDDSFLDGDYLINFDGESIKHLTIGCASGIYKIIQIKFSRKEYNENLRFIPFQISIKGLKGGHSGVDINKNRQNAIKLLALLLWKLRKENPYYLISMNAGGSQNAIPRESYAEIYIKKEFLENFEISYNNLIKESMNIFSLNEPNIEIKLEKINNPTYSNYLSLEDTSKMIDFLFLIPNGVISMDSKFKSLTSVSSNLATIETKRSKFRLQILQRGFNQFETNTVYERIECLLNLIELSFKVKHIGSYGEWAPNSNSKLLEITKKAYKKVFDCEPNLKIVHAGLECGVFKFKRPKLDLLSCGCEIKNAHSPDEKLSINSVLKAWKLILEILNKINSSL